MDSGCFPAVMPFFFFGIFIAITVVTVIYSTNQKKAYLQVLATTIENAQIGGFAPVFLGGIYI